MRSMFLLIAVVLSAPMYAQSQSDCRLLGGTQDERMFYDASGVRKLPDGHFEIWLKSLPGKAMVKRLNARAKDKDLTDHAARKLASG